jgi:hypothetical protein
MTIVTTRWAATQPAAIKVFRIVQDVLRGRACKRPQPDPRCVARARQSPLQSRSQRILNTGPEPQIIADPSTL